MNGWLLSFVADDASGVINFGSSVCFRRIDCLISLLIRVSSWLLSFTVRMAWESQSRSQLHFCFAQNYHTEHAQRRSRWNFYKDVKHMRKDVGVDSVKIIIATDLVISRERGDSEKMFQCVNDGFHRHGKTYLNNDIGMAICLTRYPTHPRGRGTSEYNLRCKHQSAVAMFYRYENSLPPENDKYSLKQVIVEINCLSSVISDVISRVNFYLTKHSCPLPTCIHACYRALRSYPPKRNLTLAPLRNGFGVSVCNDTRDFAICKWYDILTLVKTYESWNRDNVCLFDGIDNSQCRSWMMDRQALLNCRALSSHMTERVFVYLCGRISGPEYWLTTISHLFWLSTRKPTSDSSTHRRYQEVEIDCRHVIDASGLIDGIREEEFKKRFDRRVRERVYYCCVCSNSFRYQTRTASFYGDYVHKTWSDTLELVEMFNRRQTDARWICVRCAARDRNTTNWYHVASEMRATPNRVEASRRIRSTESRRAVHNFPILTERS